VEVTSTEGQGATFCIWLPVWVEPVDTADAPAAPAAPAPPQEARSA